MVTTLTRNRPPLGPYRRPVLRVLGNPVLRVLGNSETMRRAEQGEERRRAAVLQNTISIAAADFGFFAEGGLSGGYM